MSTLALYSPEDVVILLGGIYQVTGTHEGSFITISEGGNQWETTVTADGRVSRTHIKDPTHSVSITLASTADANSVFSAWTSADNFLFGAMIPLFIKDNMGTTLFYAPMSWVEKVPDSSFSTDVEPREWVLRTAGATSTIGGNESGGMIDSDLASLGFISADFAGLF